MNFKTYIESVDQQQIQTLVANLQAQYPGLQLYVSQRPASIYIHEIKVPPALRGQGIGTKIIQAVQQYAKQVNLPITLSPSPDRGKKAKLLNFYKSLGFRNNSGRYRDYSLSSPFGPTWLWRPTWS